MDLQLWVSCRALFLIFVVAVILRVPIWQVFLIVAGYIVFSRVDRWLIEWQRDIAINEEIEHEALGWEPDPDDPKFERKEIDEHMEWMRWKIDERERAVVTRTAMRVAGMLRRLP